MKQLLPILLLLTSFVFLGCKPKQVVENPDPPQPPSTVVCGSELSRGSAQYQDPLASFEGMVDGDCLQLKISYSGGCKEHEFDLYWSGDWDKTKPPVAHLYLSHNANGDNCEAIKTQKLGFSLQQIRFPGNGQVIVEVHAPGVPLVRASYSYK
jgi:hypothetical protein